MALVSIANFPIHELNTIVRSRGDGEEFISLMFYYIKASSYACSRAWSFWVTAAVSYLPGTMMRKKILVVQEWLLLYYGDGYSTGFKTVLYKIKGWHHGGLMLYLTYYVPNRSQKHKISFLISRKKTSSWRIVSHQGFPQCENVILWLVRYVFPASTSA